MVQVTKYLMRRQKHYFKSTKTTLKMESASYGMREEQLYSKGIYQVYLVEDATGYDLMKRTRSSILMVGMIKHLWVEGLVSKEKEETF